jgi:glucose/arabinose dehydrogenase
VAASGLSSPLYAASPAGDGRLFIVEQGGTVRILKNGGVLPAAFLDISARISVGGEHGLLSIAFHPSYAANGYFFLYYTDLNGDIQISRFTVSANPDVADAGSEKPILKIPHPTNANHNGGLVMFGPDGKLYIGTGDGGGAGDTAGNAQNRNTLLGKVLRIDVDGGDPYAIPADNPFVGQAGMKGEIWAWGVRNPWRFSFDAGLLYVADVGQASWEEVDVVSASAGGLNYGWNTMEGTHCYGASSCSQAGLTLPVLEYDHSGGACAVTGGFVYRGGQIPELDGTYFYADYCAGWVKSFQYTGGTVTEQHDWQLGGVGDILSFGKDASGELYVLTAGGTVYRITRAP